MARLLIVDDDAAFRETLAETLVSLGHEVVESGSGAGGLRLLQQDRFDAMFLDHRMSGMDGLQTLAAVRQRVSAPPPVIVLTAHASGSNTIEAMRLGAFDHLAKPVGREDVQAVLARALHRERPASAGRQGDQADQAGTGDALIGISAAMREVHKRIGLASASEAPVLILGETGTGKEMVARALHRHSTRGDQPFVAVNCAAIPKDLLETELFGHVRGAYTGAVGERPGCFRAADGGVLLLDEIGDMALTVQAKILRVLQEGEVTPLGSHRPVKIDVRIVAATHRDLATGVQDGSFREDLRYRLDVIAIRLPPLRERLADIIPLAEQFLRLAADPAPPKALSAGAAQCLLRQPWPGNVRELKNVMERCQALVRHPVIGETDLDLGGAAPSPGGDDLPAAWRLATLPDAVERLERALIAQALQASGGQRVDAARRLGIHRQLLYRKLAQYGMG